MGFYKESIRVFGEFGIKHMSGYLSPLKEEMTKSNLNILFETYVGKMLMLTFFSFFITFTAVTFTLTILVVHPLIVIVGAFVAAGTISLAVLTFYHSYPLHILTSKRNSIESSMPFAINHMGAIAASGVPPFVIFKLISNIPEYGEVTNESKRIVRNVEAFGMDVSSAIKNVANRTPSPQFRQFLYGLVSTIETGGDTKTFLENSAKEALFDYKLKREKYMQTLSTYADFYTAVLIAAPLFFVSVLSILSLIGGQIFGLSIPVAMRLGVYVFIPLLNMLFIMFIHYTQPSI